MDGLTRIERAAPARLRAIPTGKERPGSAHPQSLTRSPRQQQFVGIGPFGRIDIDITVVIGLAIATALGDRAGGKGVADAAVRLAP